MTGLRRHCDAVEMELARKNAHGVESMAAHGAEGRSREYIGSERADKYVYDYYVDDCGDYWYETRVATEKGIVSMEEYLFGRRLPRRSGGQRKRRGYA